MSLEEGVGERLDDSLEELHLYNSAISPKNEANQG